MFPVFDFNTQIMEEETAKETKIGRSFTFDYTSKKFAVAAGKVQETTQEQAIRQWIELLIRTAANKYKVYEDTGFGTSIDKLVGHRGMRGFVESEMKRELSENITKNRAIEGMENFETEFEGDNLQIKFKVILKNDEILEVVSNV